MKFTLSWLKNHLDTHADLKTLCDTLTMIGLEVESVDNPAERLKDFTVAKIIEATPHPNADRLKVCQVDTRDGRKDIVCGAANARAGLMVAYAPENSFIPGLGITLKKAKIRGVESCGMLCSAKELQVGSDAAGILELPASAHVGDPVARALGLDDAVLDINLTPNRPDCTGVRGIARDLAAAGLGTLKPYPITSSSTGAFDCPVSVTLESDSGCPQFALRLVRGVKNGASPAWLAQRLEAVGLRPISALVDITNYLSVELGRPLHVFDAKKLKGNLTLYAAHGGETLAALDNATYTLPKGAITIRDDSGVISLAGIVGGVSTAVDDTTQDVLIECALFDAPRISGAGQALGVLSDARYRFERGVDPDSVISGINRCTDLILDICGGSASHVRTAGAPPAWQKSIPFQARDVHTRGGVDISADECTRILRALGFTVEKNTVTPPSWRPDIDGTADLVEEVLRIHGYDRITPVSLSVPAHITNPLSPTQKIPARASRHFATRGFLETVTWSFLSAEAAQMFGGQDDSLCLLNPISADLRVMRPSLLPNLLAAVERNAARGFSDVAIFETGPQFSPRGETTIIAGVRSGARAPKHWSTKQSAVDVFDAKADVDSFLETLGVRGASVSRNAPAHYHPGRSGALMLGKKTLAYFGDIHPAILSAMAIDAPTVGFEILVDALPLSKPKSTARSVLALSSLQPVTRDFAFVVTAQTAAADILNAVRGVDPLIDDIALFDIYEGTRLEAGKKSVAFSVRLQPFEATLTDAQIDALSQKIIRAVEAKTGGTLRA